jgi:two-component system sensor histidine kinase YesM
VDWIGKIAKKDPYGSMMANVGGKEHIIAYSISDVTGWIVAIMLPYNSFGNVVTRRIFLLVISMAAFFILASFVSSYFVSNRFSKKILGTLKAVEQVTDANFDAELQYNEHEEFAFFYERLNWMQNNMMRLIYENYEAELRKKDFEIMVLNIQLNPHFLYNTLNIINWVCIEENAYRSSDIIVKLSRMLQYTSDNSMELTPLRSDIEWIQQYIFIMSIRYEKKFSVSYNIHDSLLDMRVPKLFLQPLVENAIIHGFCNIQTGGILNIAGIPLDDHVLFSVEDNGIGINKEKAEAIMRDENNSIGIKNTDRRIKMLFGMQYGLFIDSKPGSGTVIMIKMPLD